ITVNIACPSDLHRHRINHQVRTADPNIVPHPRAQQQAVRAERDRSVVGVTSGVANYQWRHETDSLLSTAPKPRRQSDFAINSPGKLTAPAPAESLYPLQFACVN